jgi:hypothetical protein
VRGEGRFTPGVPPLLRIALESFLMAGWQMPAMMLGIEE